MLTNGCFAVTIQWYLVQRFLDALIECIGTLFFFFPRFFKFRSSPHFVLRPGTAKILQMDNRFHQELDMINH